MDVIEAGRLGERSLASILADAADRRLDIRLELTEGDGTRHTLDLVAGEVVGLSSPEFTPSGIFAKVDEQTCYAIGKPGGVLLLRSGMDPLPVIREAMRGREPDSAVSAALEAFDDRPLVLHPRAPLHRFGFTRRQLSVLRGLARNPVTRRELEARDPSWREVLAVLAFTRCLAGAAAAPIGAEPAPEPPENARQGRARYFYAAFVLALAPLAWSVVRDVDDTADRVAETARANEGFRSLLERGNASNAELFAALPEGKIVGAALGYHSRWHWLFGLGSVVVMLLAMVCLFERGEAKLRSLLGAGLFTGTVGILLLIAFQIAAEASTGLRMVGLGLWSMLLHIVRIIGFSYQAALDPSNGLLASFLGFTLGVGLCEEVTKALPVFVRLRRAPLGWRETSVWGLASGAGFGVAEGVHYSSTMYNGLATVDTYVVRFVSCVALHAIWAASAALLLHRRRDVLARSRSVWMWLVLLLRANALPMVLHGGYDTLLKRERDALAFGVAAVSFAVLAYFVERARREGGETVREALPTPRAVGPELGRRA
ncbi:MAG: PrsW family intramembrane metalloprotease [Deltaproteobacteria bacterium]|nr:PrsW family intramembrane metalloprotease [Deltaproteobacteria bacterium]